MNEEIRNNEEIKEVVKEEKLEDVSGGIFGVGGDTITCSKCGAVLNVREYTKSPFCKRCKAPIRFA